MNWQINNIIQQGESVTKDFGNISISIEKKIKCYKCKKEKSFYPSSCCGNSYNNDCDLTLNVDVNSSFRSDFKKLLFSEELSDFGFKIDKETIPVHKAILSARSPVFLKMFTSEFEESTKNVLDLSLDFSTEAFKEMIRFIYTEKIINFNDNVYDLLYASDFYQIDDLKALCDKKLLEILNAENANKIYQSAHAYGSDKNVIQASFEMIKKSMNTNNYDLPMKLLNEPEKVDKIVTLKEDLEKVLNHYQKE